MHYITRALKVYTMESIFYLDVRAIISLTMHYLNTHVK